MQGLRYLAHHPVLRSMAVWVCLLNLFFNMAHAVLILYSIEVLRLGSTGYGLLLSAAGAGALAAAALSPRVVGWLGRGPTMLAASMIAAVATIATGLTGRAYLVGAFQFLSGLSAVSFTIVGRSLRQSLSPDDMIGRITNTYRMLGYGMIPVGAMLGGWEAAAFGLRTPFLIAGIGVLCVSTVTGTWLLRSLVDRELAAPDGSGRSRARNADDRTWHRRHPDP
jgi:MFS family permease